MLPTEQVAAFVLDVHLVAPLAHAFVQHIPALQAPLVQVVLADSCTQVCASFEHVASVEASAHLTPMEL